MLWSIYINSTAASDVNTESIKIFKWTPTVRAWFLFFPLTDGIVDAPSMKNPLFWKTLQDTFLAFCHLPIRFQIRAEIPTVNECKASTDQRSVRKVLFLFMKMLKKLKTKKKQQLNTLPLFFFYKQQSDELLVSGTIYLHLMCSLRFV